MVRSLPQIIVKIPSRNSKIYTLTAQKAPVIHVGDEWAYLFWGLGPRGVIGRIIPSQECIYGTSDKLRERRKTSKR
jgi:hypothetical protein